VNKQQLFALRLVGLGLLAATAAPAAHAGHADADTVAFGGTTACGGNHFNRVAGTEGQRAVYVLRNFGDSEGIRIERIRFFDATGATLFDSDATGLPPFVNGVLGPADDSLGPHQTALLRSQDVLGGALPVTGRPIQVHIDWSAEKKVLLLDAVMIRLSRDRDAASGGLGDERARHLLECRHVRIQNGKGEDKDKQHQDDD